METETCYKNILIIGAEVQPIPPVEGGAVELLVDFILKENEKNRFGDFMNRYKKYLDIERKGAEISKCLKN